MRRNLTHFTAQFGQRLALVVLCVGATVLTLLPVELHAQTDAATQQFVFAYRLYQQQDDRLALQAFSDFLRDYPGDTRRGDAIYYQALLTRKQNQSPQAARLLENLPPPTLVPALSVTLLRAQLHLDQQQYAPALALLEPLPTDGLAVEAQAALQHMRAQAYLGQGNPAAALSQLESAAKLETPLRARIVFDQAQTLAQLGRLSEAVVAAQNVINLNDVSLTPWAATLAGELSLRSAKPEEAANFYRVVIERHQTSSAFPTAVLGLMNAHLAAARPQAVIEIAQQWGSKLTGDELSQAGLLTGTALMQNNQPQDAIAQFNATLAGSPAAGLRDQLLYQLAQAHAQLQQSEAMLSVLQRLAAVSPDSPLNREAQLLVAAHEYAKGDANAAAALLTQVIDQPSPPEVQARARLQRARLYEAIHQIEPAARDYQAFIQQFDAAPASGEKPLEASLRTQAALRLMSLQLRLNQPQAAAETAGAVLSRKPVEAVAEQEAMLHRAHALARLQQVEPALQQINQLLERHPQSSFTAEARYARGLLQLASGQTSAALADLEFASQQAELALPLRTSALRLLAQSYQAMTDRASSAQQALQTLEKIAGVEALQSDELLWLAERELALQQPSQVMRYVQRLLQQEQELPPALRARAILTAGSGLRLSGDLDGAILAYRKVVNEAQGLENQARLELARTLAQQGKLREALSEYQPMISDSISQLAAAACLESARLQRRLALENPPAASDHLNEARKLYKRIILLHDHPQLQPLPELAYLELAEVENELTLSSESAQTLEQLIAKHPDRPASQYARAVQAMRLQKRGDAQHLLSQLRAKPDELPTDLRPRVEARWKEVSP